jgi:hypothetical protein
MDTMIILGISTQLILSILQIYWLLLSAVFGSMRLFFFRSEWNPDKTFWSFGQILPVILLAGPMLTLIECFYSGMSTWPISISKVML